MINIIFEGYNVNSERETLLHFSRQMTCNHCDQTRFVPREIQFIASEYLTGELARLYYSYKLLLSLSLYFYIYILSQ